MIRVLVAEDSAVTREYLACLLTQDPSLQVVGLVQNGREVVEQTERLRPDVVLMDVHMPLMNGYEATRQIMQRVATPIVMVTSSLSRDEVAMSFEALSAGALTILDKPFGPSHPDSAKTALQLQETVRLMAGVKVIHRWARPSGLAAALPLSIRTRTGSNIRLAALGASTGGPTVMAEILAGLPRTFPLPILAVQHISREFTPGLAEWMGRATPLRVKIAEPAEAALPGTVYVAPYGFHMGITPEMRIRLTTGTMGDDFCPSVSYLFQSVAESLGRFAAGILLSGMGQDGAYALLELRRAGGLTIAQDEETSVVFGMPGEAVRLGAAQHVLSPAHISDLLRGLV